MFARVVAHEGNKIRALTPVQIDDSNERTARHAQRHSALGRNDHSTA
jgi:hypothetical protein